MNVALRTCGVSVYRNISRSHFSVVVLPRIRECEKAGCVEVMKTLVSGVAVEHMANSFAPNSARDEGRSIDFEKLEMNVCVIGMVRS